MKEIKLPSGAVLKISHVTFEDSWNLYQAVCTEMRNTPFSSQVEMSTMIKDIVLIGFSSPVIYGLTKTCFKRCTYNTGKGDLTIDAQTFEPEGTREDYILVLTEVLEYAIGPFMKHLYAVYSRVLLTLTKSQE